MSYVKNILFLGLFALLNAVSAQEAFICDGDFFLVLSNGGASNFYRVEVAPGTGNVVFNQIGTGNTGQRLNAIAYRVTDNLIYAIGQSDSRLYRIDATGVATLITDPGLRGNLGYYAATITPDGNTMILVASNFNGVNEELVSIDLTQNPPVVSNTQAINTTSVFCTDVAFDPITGLLYGFDNNGNRLVRINPDNGIIDSSFPQSTVSDAMGALFFDPFGNLWGYGNLINSGLAVTLFQINKNNGQITERATGPPASGKDGCACPYTVNLNKRVFPEETFPCTEVIYTFEVANQSGIIQQGIEFEDFMPNEFTITEIIKNPFGGNLLSGPGSSYLHITDMEVPLGIDSIIVKVEIGPNALGTYRNQAVLNGLPASLGSSTLSDDPMTLQAFDSTDILINELFIDLENDTLLLCEGQNTTLDASAHGLTYLWMDGSTDPTYEVTQGGLYSVIASSGCETVSDSIYVSFQSLLVELAESHEIELGESIVLTPNVFPNGQFIYTWTDTLGNSLDCLDCPFPLATPYFDASYTLTIDNGNGCTATDSVFIKVLKNREIYIPNAFSPNGDGFNDLFFVQGRGIAYVRKFMVYNRWGDLMYEDNNFEINDDSHSWDGTFKGKNMTPGVYVYAAEIEFLDGVRQWLAGDITLLR